MLSKLRFSPIITITCLIGVVVLEMSTGPPLPPPPHPAASIAIASTRLLDAGAKTPLLVIMAVRQSAPAGERAGLFEVRHHLVGEQLDVLRYLADRYSGRGDCDTEGLDRHVGNRRLDHPDRVLGRNHGHQVEPFQIVG